MARKRSQAELIGASSHLRYEIDMLRGVARALENSDVRNPVIHNSLVESFTIHARVVLDFLYSDGRKDDVVATDFFPDPSTWITIRPEMPSTLDSVKSRVGKEIAHLTYARQTITKEAKRWAFVGIANEVSKLLEVFLRNVPTTNLVEEWKDYSTDLSKGKPATNTLGLSE